MGEKYLIGESSLVGEKVWIVPSREHPFENGIGDTIHRTQESAQSEVEWNIKLDEQDNRRKETTRRQQDEATAIVASLNDLDGYEETLSPMQLGKATKTLHHTMMFNGELMQRIDYVRQAISSGSMVGETMGETAIVHSDGSYMAESSIGRIAIDYARYLCRG